MPFDRSKYPLGWKKIVAQVRARSGDRCECRGECGDAHGDRRCNVANHEPHPTTGSRVVLITAHLCRCRDPHGIKCGNLDHLIHACQRCHLAIDRTDHVAAARARRHARRAVADLFPDAR